MNESLSANTVEVKEDIAWAVNIFEVIRSIRQSNETKIRTVNLLVEEEARIQMQPREFIRR